MARTVAKFLWQGYISIFGALVKLLIDWGATFESNIISELCELMGIQRVRTSLYHPPTNRQVEQAHQMLMWMIGKLGKDWKADWYKHLPELVHAYNSTGLAITGYNPHCLMYGWWPHLPINFYFPTIVSPEKQHIADLCEWLHEAFRKAQAHPPYKAERQRWYYACKTNAISLELGDLVLAKVNAYKERRKVKDWWEKELCEVECRIAEGVSSYLMKNQWTRHSWVLHQNWLFLITPIMGAPLSTGVWAEQSRCTTTVLEEPTHKVGENRKVPQSAKCLPPAQHQTGKTPLGQVNRKLFAFLRTFSRASLPDQGWKVWCRGKGDTWH